MNRKYIPWCLGEVAGVIQLSLLTDEFFDNFRSKSFCGKKEKKIICENEFN